jgi:hypothetical protein
MSNQKTTHNRRTGKPKELHKVLLEEYKELGILSQTEVEDIVAARGEIIGKFRRKCRKAAERKHTFEEREEIIRERLVAGSKYRYRMLEIIRQKIHAKKAAKRPTALCLSGGGIRSATFCLGVLQGLARNNLLDKFDYLSTVSGGGYIGSWLSAWQYREGNMEKVQSALSRNGDYPYLLGLEDFKIDFNAELCPLMKEQLQTLRETLDQHKKFFKRESINKLAESVPVPPASDEKAAAANELRKFGQSLCYELNQIIHNQKNESAELRARVEERIINDDPRERKKIKRQIIEEMLENIVNPLDDFEHIEPPEITYLRTYSNFMSPRTGFSSLDTWTIVATYLRNLMLNWTVFLPLIAIFLLLPKLFPALLKSPFLDNLLLPLFWFSVAAGILAVTNIIAMRPTLSRYSWIRQKYKLDNDGSIINTEKKVWRWCLAPMIGVAFAVTACWSLVMIKPEAYQSVMDSNAYQFVMGFLPNSFPETKKLFGFIAFYEVLFLVGFVIAHSILWTFRLKNAEPSLKVGTGKDLWHLFWEFCASLVSGAIGGAVLYLFARILPAAAGAVSEWFKTHRAEFDSDLLYICFGPPLFLITVLLSTAFFFGIAGRIYSDMDREWLSRFGALIILMIIVWSVLSFIVLLSPNIVQLREFKQIFWIRETIPASVIIAVISGFITLVFGFSGRSPASEDKDSKGILNLVWKHAPQFAAPVFALALIILISYGTSLLMEFARPRLTARLPQFAAYLSSDFWYLIIWILLFAAIAATMGFFININKFSLHAMYRERLIRAYLGASRTEDRLTTANSFTDLDDKDNLEIYKLDVQKPFHVVNMTLNLGGTNNLRWQDRKAASFTVTPLHCGSSNMGDGSGNYRSSKQYGYSGTNNQAITLGTVAAISGAAVSPNMGYYSMSSAVSFLMALFNVRLGWWLGNPGKRGDKTFMRSAPLFSPRLLWDEAVGDTTDTNRYVYLSDGGHFDNLGLYEMVLRRCHVIVACDAGADFKFGFFDLGTAIHKIRVDMGIPIVFKAGTPEHGRNCAIAEIKYSAIDENADDGFLIYIKPTLDGDEPIDVVNYKNINPDFPHETTGDEFYSETQFESYRSLGFHMINSISAVEGNLPCASITDFKKRADGYLKKKNAAAQKPKASKSPVDKPKTGHTAAASKKAPQSRNGAPTGETESIV